LQKGSIHKTGEKWMDRGNNYFSLSIKEMSSPYHERKY